MKNLKSILSIILIAVLSLVFTSNTNAQKKKEFTVAWSIYAGWNPWKYAQESGILQKHAQKEGITIKLVKMDYIPSIEAYVTPHIDACVMTNMDCLTIPVASGIKSTALITGDFSNGNDAILVRNNLTLKDALQTQIFGVEYSVSHYLVFRAAQAAGVEFDKIRFTNTSDSDIAPAFISNKNGDQEVVVTWNPLVMEIAKTPGITNVFNSSKIPGEVLDMMVVKTEILDANPALGRALVGAWYEVMKIMQERTPRANAAIETMAKAGGSSVTEYKAQLKTTAMFYKASDAVKYVSSEETKKNMKKVRNFCQMFDLLGVKNVNDLGIQYPDGTVLGDENNIIFKIDTKYMKMAADGKL